MFWPTQLAGLSDRFAQLQRHIVPDGAIWAVIPKKPFARARGIDFGWSELQGAALRTDLVDNKVATLSEEEYATRFVIRKDRRGRYATGESPSQGDDMMTDADNRALQAYLNRPLDDLMAELELYDPASRGPADVWNKVAGPLRQRLCDEWKWCEVRQDQRWDDDLALALAVLGVLSARVLHLPIPADLALLATIVVKRGLDVFCGCP